MLNYKINNHGKNEIKHDYLIFITAKEKSYTAKTGARGPKQLILLQKQIADGKNQSSGQQFLVKGHPSTWCVTVQYVHDIDFHISFCLYYLLLFLPLQGFGPEAKTRGGTLGFPACIHNYKEFQNVRK